MTAAPKTTHEAQPMTDRDFFTQVALGDISVPGLSFVHKFGRNGAVGTSFEGVHLLGAEFKFLTSPEAVRIKAGGNEADTVDGDGARKITVEGIGDDLLLGSAEIVTAGALASDPTTETFWRIFRSYMSPASAGAYGGTNTGDIVIENAAGGSDLIKIGAGEGQSQYGAYSIPADKKGYLYGAHVTVNTNQEADVRVMTRDNFDTVSAPYEPARLRLFWEGLKEHFPYEPRSPEFEMGPSTDIWVEAKAGAATSVSVDFEILLVEI